VEVTYRRPPLADRELSLQIGAARYAVRACAAGVCPAVEAAHGDVATPDGLQLLAGADGALTLVVPAGGYPAGLLTQGVPGVLQHPLAPRRGPLDPLQIGSVPQETRRALRLDCQTCSCSLSYHPLDTVCCEGY
jgi:hypothetical protein